MRRVDLGVLTVYEVDHAGALHRAVLVGVHEQAGVLINADAQGFRVLGDGCGKAWEASSCAEVGIYDCVFAYPAEATRHLHDPKAQFTRSSTRDYHWPPHSGCTRACTRDYCSTQVGFSHGDLDGGAVQHLGEEVLVAACDVNAGGALQQARYFRPVRLIVIADEGSVDAASLYSQTLEDVAVVVGQDGGMSGGAADQDDVALGRVSFRKLYVLQEKASDNGPGIEAVSPTYDHEVAWGLPGCVQLFDVVPTVMRHYRWLPLLEYQYLIIR